MGEARNSLEDMSLELNVLAAGLMAGMPQPAKC